MRRYDGRGGERVCAAGIYTAWTEPGAPGELHALAHLLCRDGAGAYAARFVHVTAAPWTGSAAAVAAALRDASGTGALADPALWRGAHGAVMAALRRALPALAFYEPLRFETDPATNLVTAATPAGGGGEEETTGEGGEEDEDEAGPRAGIIHVDADVVVDRDAARARHRGVAAARPAARHGRLRRALRRDHDAADQLRARLRGGRRAAAETPGRDERPL